MPAVMFHLVMQESIPYTLKATITDGKNTWATVGAFEARAQVRKSRFSTSTKVDDLTPFLTKAIVGNDVVVTLALTGAEVTARTPGHYDLVVSDVGTTDGNAVRPIYGEVKVNPTATKASDA